MPRVELLQLPSMHVTHGPAGGAKDSSGGIDLLEIKGHALPLVPEVGDHAP
jgi:hypothetical protein